MKPRPLIIPVFLPNIGCPHRCAFCNQRSVTSSRPRVPSPERLRAHIETWLTRRGPRRGPVEISFFGGNFLGLDPPEVVALLATAAAFVESGSAQGLRFSTRPDSVTHRALALIRPHPVATVELGAQSMDNSVLEAARRGHDAEDTVKGVRQLKAAGYRVGLQMMVGLPGETPAGALDSARRMAQLAPEFVRIYPTLVLRGSRLARWYRRGSYRPLTLSAAVRRVKRSYRIFAGAGIPVARMGLAPDPALETGRGRVAGPFHPAFGHLVLSEVLYDRVVRELEAVADRRGRVEICVHPHSLSRLLGIRRCNLYRLKRRFEELELRVATDTTLGRDDVRLTQGRDYMTDLKNVSASVTASGGCV